MRFEDIRRLVEEGRYEFSFHAQQERLEDDLDVGEIEDAILHGEILEQYSNDLRGESCLVVGYAGEKAIHVVIGWARRGEEREGVLRVITVYVPQPPRWLDPRTRGGAS